ncbi:MAG: YitT family protein [Muribaculaceae bacterium]|nr:YitT family protein [Muribaculaceae bacterium]
MIKIDPKRKLWREILAYVLLTVGSLLFAIGDVLFVNPYLMAPGGTYGLSNVFNTLWPWKISLYAICMDIPLLLIGTWILGPKFGVKTIVSTALIFAFTFVLESWWGYNPIILDGAIVQSADPSVAKSMVEIPHHGGWFHPDYFLNTVVAGIIYGVAIGLIFRSGATSGGSDIISMILHKYTKVSLGTLVMIVDGIITLSTLIAFHDIRLPIYSIIIIFIEGKVIDLVVDGMKTYKTMFIVTDQVDAVRDYVINDIKRGGTLISGVGLYKGSERKMLYVTLDRSDMIKLRSVLYHIDPHAFVNIMESSEILGEGFRRLPQE